MRPECQISGNSEKVEGVRERGRNKPGAQVFKNEV